ncbi:MAG: hypothetical protein WAV00_14230 [Nocardioides sp.]
MSEVVVPAIRAVFREGEVTAFTVSLDRELAGGSLTLSLTAVGEEFRDLVVQGDVRAGVDDWRERLRSDLADFVAESGFGWGQDRGV